MEGPAGPRARDVAARPDGRTAPAAEPARSAPQVERAAGLAVAGSRVATLAQMAPSVVAAFDASTRPGLCAVTWAVATATSAGTIVLSVVRRRPPGRRWATVDVTVAAALLVLGLLTVSAGYRTGSWIGFQGAYSLSVACALIGVRRRGAWLTLLAVLVAARAVYLLPALGSGVGFATMAGELLTLLCLAPLAWAGTGAMYRIAQDADRAREYAAHLAREEEERRARTAIHNGTALLKLLVEQAHDDPTDSRTPSQVWVQAASELNRMRAYLAGQGRRAAGRADEPQDLATLVETVAAEFADLPLDVVPDLARGVLLDDEADDVAAALRSLLINVRQHAGAARVVLHAEQLEDEDGWAVTLHDDGRGFDPSTTRLGVGVRGLVVESLAAHAITATVDSVPGLGTTATLRSVTRSRTPTPEHAVVAPAREGRP
ncbi:ATP-binding protein [Luteimicrobium subarcticum]|uniref:Signal transduction histidine kinase n=1 Tax=Luteimicrobium subarcticum TaxID=620910 RepID=A0A2M8WSE3_9MICO|nr:ATP-binding protein [Luteimicrobium subarcticum]PJI93814.1 signal transduction histidine kinase [Luteimicrobium subarcticum]